MDDRVGPTEVGGRRTPRTVVEGDPDRTGTGLTGRVGRREPCLLTEEVLREAEWTRDRPTYGTRETMLTWLVTDETNVQTKGIVQHSEELPSLV